MKSSKILIGKNCVYKSDDVESLKIEFHKMSMAHSIGLASGVFYVPKIYDFDDVKSVLTMEKIDNLTPIRKFINNKSKIEYLAGLAGKSLNLIHNNIYLPELNKVGLPFDYDDKKNKAFIHGDFNMENICVSQMMPNKIIIIDWQTTKLHGGLANYATSFFDVAWFVNHLFNRPLNIIGACGGLDNICLTFLNSYFSNKCHSDLEDFFDYNEKFIRFKSRDRRRTNGQLKRLIGLPGDYGWKNFQKKRGL